MVHAERVSGPIMELHKHMIGRFDSMKKSIQVSINIVLFNYYYLNIIVVKLLHVLFNNYLFIIIIFLCINIFFLCVLFFLYIINV